LESGIDLIGCEYLGGCPTVGSRVLNKVQLHFDSEGLTVAVAPQGLFTLAAARPVLAVPWSEITQLRATTTRPRRMSFTARRVARLAVDVLTMRLDLPDQLVIGTPAWAMTVGVRVTPTELTRALHELLASRDGPAPAVTTT
jgi:hypothetical protein